MAMSCMTLPVTKGRPYTDTDSDGKTEIITDITCKFKVKLIAMEVKVDPESETNCTIESFQAPAPGIGCRFSGANPVIFQSQLTFLVT